MAIYGKIVHIDGDPWLVELPSVWLLDFIKAMPMSRYALFWCRDNATGDSKLQDATAYITPWSPGTPDTSGGVIYCTKNRSKWSVSPSLPMLPLCFLPVLTPLRIKNGHIGINHDLVTPIPDGKRVRFGGIRVQANPDGFSPYYVNAMGARNASDAISELRKVDPWDNTMRFCDTPEREDRRLLFCKYGNSMISANVLFRGVPYSDLERLGYTARVELEAG